MKITMVLATILFSGQLMAGGHAGGVGSPVVNSVMSVNTNTMDVLIENEAIAVFKDGDKRVVLLEDENGELYLVKEEVTEK